MSPGDAERADTLLVRGSPTSYSYDIGIITMPYNLLRQSSTVYLAGLLPGEIYKTAYIFGTL